MRSAKVLPIHAIRLLFFNPKDSPLLKMQRNKEKQIRMMECFGSIELSE
ncbi:MAG: hypothetical protein VX848_09230 [Verrucomicrobiota bacterium]|nr:hypothetical protein [Verrucomicrobiota bacterium]